MLTPEELQTVQYYDDNAREWGAAHASADYWRRELDQFAAFLPPGAGILETGPGAGTAAHYFLEHGFTYLGTDVSAGLLEYAASQVPDAEFRLLSPYALDTGGREFGGWWATASLIHVPHARMHDVLTGIAACLSSGARGFISLRTATETRAVTELGRNFFLWRQQDLDREVSRVFDVTDSYAREGKYDWQWSCLFLRKLTS